MSESLLEKQAQLSAMQSHTETLEADLEQLVALKRQVDKAGATTATRTPALLELTFLG